MDMDLDEWPSDWLRAVLPLMSLAILATAPAHGYAMLQTLDSMGLGSVKGSALYPLLARQQERGHVDHRWETGAPGPARKVFFLTDQGRHELERLAHAWRRLDTIVVSVTTHTIRETG